MNFFADRVACCFYYDCPCLNVHTKYYIFPKVVSQQIVQCEAGLRRCSYDFGERAYGERAKRPHLSLNNNQYMGGGPSGGGRRSVPSDDTVLLNNIHDDS